MNDRRKRRPNRAVVEQLLNLDGQHVDVRHAELHEDVDGAPLGVESVDDGTAMLVVPGLALLGWTQEEWDDPTITE